MDNLAAGQFNNIHVDSDPGARGMMDANNYKSSPMSINASSLGSYDNDMANNFAHPKGVGLKVKPYSAQTMTSTTWSKQ